MAPGASQIAPATCPDALRSAKSFHARAISFELSGQSLTISGQDCPHERPHSGAEPVPSHMEQNPSRVEPEPSRAERNVSRAEPDPSRVEPARSDVEPARCCEIAPEIPLMPPTSLFTVRHPTGSPTGAAGIRAAPPHPPHPSTFLRSLCGLSPYRPMPARLSMSYARRALDSGRGAVADLEPDPARADRRGDAERPGDLTGEQPPLIRAAARGVQRLCGSLRDGAVERNEDS